jgi:hypothetical protein
MVLCPKMHILSMHKDLTKLVEMLANVPGSRIVEVLKRLALKVMDLAQLYSKRPRPTA